MCMEDVRLGRELYGAPKNVSGTLSTGAICLPADPKRTRIIWAGDGINPCCVYPDGFAGSSAIGYHVTGGSPVLVMRIEDYGLIVTGPWRAEDGGVGANLIVTALTLEKK